MVNMELMCAEGDVRRLNAESEQERVVEEGEGGEPDATCTWWMDVPRASRHAMPRSAM